MEDIGRGLFYRSKVLHEIWNEKELKELADNAGKLKKIDIESKVITTFNVERAGT